MLTARLGRIISGAVMTAALLSAISAYPLEPADAATPVRAGFPAPSITKVLVIAEENVTYDRITGNPDAAYLNKLASIYGSASNMTANYPAACPSLAGYVLMTSGSSGQICDDKSPKHHRLAGDNIFAQVDAAHLTWRGYAEDMPSPCAKRDSADGIFLVRHTPAAYYATERHRCAADEVALGTLRHGALHTAIKTGTLPSYAFVTPNACDDMHGAPACPNHRILRGDTWLAQWIPQLISGADYQAGRLAIIITWDEGSKVSNHIPLFVIAPGARTDTSGQPLDHCSTLGAAEDILHLSHIGCAAAAESVTDAFPL
jgi:hypothetical protein